MSYKSILFLFFIFPMALSAQFISDYGIKISVISSEASIKTGSFYMAQMYKDARVSGAFGLFAHFLNSNYYRFSAELGYKQEGAEDQIAVTTWEDPDGTGEFLRLDHEFDFAYFALSFQPKIETERFSFYGIISPTINYLLKYSDAVYLKGDIDDIVFGYNVGFGFHPKTILNGKVFFEAEYGSSFSEFAENQYIGTKFNSLKFSIGGYLK